MIKYLKNFETILTPNQISIIGFASTLLAAAFILNHFFFLAALATLMHLICDGLDGYLARKLNKSSQLGFLLDHVFDRLSDIILFPAIGYALGMLLPGILIALTCLFSSYVGVLNKVVGLSQDKSGLFAKVYRYELLIIMLVIFSIDNTIRVQLYEYFCYGSLLIGGITIIGRLKTLFTTVLNREE
ncbi:MAG TPA: CDP-alcohol phosphatidyltransferase family protein [Bacteriovoracaceae bacterium]|nr:CDP-alcohol phosphatidyltransferase family protein [Bacteriovoracaceae bacterium]